MITVKLVHPKHGVIDKKKLTGQYFQTKVLQRWKNTYGKKINECIVVYEGRNMNNKQG